MREETEEDLDAGETLPDPRVHAEAGAEEGIELPNAVDGSRRVRGLGARRDVLEHIAISMSRRRPGSMPRRIFGTWRALASRAAASIRAAARRRHALLYRTIARWRRAVAAP